jgi:hypothetical protein
MIHALREALRIVQEEGLRRDGHVTDRTIARW